MKRTKIRGEEVKSRKTGRKKEITDKTKRTREK